MKQDRSSEEKILPTTQIVVSSKDLFNVNKDERKKQTNEKVFRCTVKEIDLNYISQRKENFKNIILKG